MELRDCFDAPILKIFEAARLLDQAVTAYIEGNDASARSLIRAADMEEIGEWLDPIWLRRGELTKAVKVANLPPIVPEAARHKPRHPTPAMKRELVRRDGHHCRYCGMPLVRKEVRQELNRHYPEAARWKSRNEKDQHRGLQVMWLQYDHLSVHSRGGKTIADNLVVSCAACNYGRDRFTLEEMRFRDPRIHPRYPTWDGRRAWTGLERILPEAKRYLQAPDSPFRPS